MSTQGAWALQRPFILGAIGVALTGIAQSLRHPDASIDIHLHDTYFVVAHLHIFIFVSLLLAFFAVMYAMYPRVTGRRMNRIAGLIHFCLTIVPVAAALWPMNYGGISGKPRRYYDYSAWESYKEFDGVNYFFSTMAVLFLLAQILFVINFLLSLLGQKRERMK